MLLGLSSRPGQGQHTGRAARHGIGDELAAVSARAGHGREQVVAPTVARIGGQTQHVYVPDAARDNNVGAVNEC